MPSSDEAPDHPRIPEDYPGIAQTERGESVTDLETRPLDGGECLLRVFTADREEPVELALTPTQVRQWETQFDLERWRADVRQTREQPALDDTVLTSACGKSFHDPEAEACAAVNAPETAIDDEMTVREAVNKGGRPCRHCYAMEEWGPDELIEEVRLRG